MPELEKPYPEIKNATLLINYQTGTCLQGKFDQGDCRLKPMDAGRQQDDVIWDRREDPVFHLLLVHYHGNHMNLPRIGERASVRHWGPTPVLHWFREQHVPYRSADGTTK